jgi:hypothetical protein
LRSLGWFCMAICGLRYDIASWWGCEGSNLAAYLTAMTAEGQIAPPGGLRILAGGDRETGGDSNMQVALSCPTWLSSSSRKVSELTPTDVFALTTPKSPIDQGRIWQLQLNLFCKLFLLSRSTL